MVDSGVDNPFKYVVDVRDNWVKIVSLIGDLNAEGREFITQKEDWIIKMNSVLVTIKREFEGKRVLYIYGSKDEKISGIMARLGWPQLKLWRFLV